MLLSTIALALKDGLAKSFLDQVGPLQTIFVQYTGTFTVMALVSSRKYGSQVLRPTPFLGQLVRGIFSAGGVATLYWGLTYIPLADATAMFMVSPIVVALLSPIILGERTNAARMVAVAVGFAGVLVILRPGFGGGAPGYLIALAAGVLMGLFLISNRALASHAPPLINVTQNALMGALVMAPFLPLFWSAPPWPVVPKLGGIIALAVIGQGLMITAFNYAPAGVLAPYTYAMLVFAALIGYFAFGTFPDLATWIGIALIVAAGLMIAHNERRAAAART
jgi:drug/metabolite transporter (DMT)-like permease